MLFRSKQNGIIPTKWRYAMHLPVGGLHESLDMESTTCEIGGATSSEAFRLVSDPGTVVVNTQGEFEKVAVTLPDGTTSDFVDRRNVRSYDELVAATKPRTPWYWWGIGLGLVAAVGYGLSRLCYRRRSA